MARLVAKDASIWVLDTSSCMVALTTSFSNVSFVTSAETEEVTDFGSTTRGRISNNKVSWRLDLDGWYSPSMVTDTIKPLFGQETCVYFSVSGSQNAQHMYSGNCILEKCDVRADIGNAVALAISFVSSGSLSSGAWPTPPPSPSTLTITAASDTSIYEAAPTTNYVSDITLNLVNWPGGHYYSLIKFDLSSIPVAASISAATLVIYGSGGVVTGSLQLYRILPVNSGWNAATATWNNASGSTVFWAGDSASDGGSDGGAGVGGTDYSNTLSGSIYLNEVLGASNNIALNLSEFGLMQASNSGFLLMRTDGAPNVQPASTKFPDVSLHPKLVITYT